MQLHRWSIIKYSPIVAIESYGNFLTIFKKVISPYKFKEIKQSRSSDVWKSFQNEQL